LTYGLLEVPPEKKMMNMGMTLGSLFGGLIIEALKDDKKRILFLAFNLIMNATFNTLLFELTYDSDTTAAMYFLEGLFCFSAYTIFFILILDIGKAHE